MRLICPNCAAQYEVDDALLPTDGRDVQCSSCGHTWFQRPDSAEATLADEMGVTEAEDDEAEPASSHEAEPTDGTSAPSPADPLPVAQPRKIDPAARDILREEARREAEARRRERGGSLETQPDLGLDEAQAAETRAAAARARLNRLRNPEAEPRPEDKSDTPPLNTSPLNTSPPDASPPEADRESAMNGSRRELLPDIEEINSTLTATSDRKTVEGQAATETEEEPSQRRGFRFGFFGVFLILVLIALVYVLAPQIAARFPSTTPVLTDYVGWVNGVLDAANDAISRGAAALTGLLNGEESR